MTVAAPPPRRSARAMFCSAVLSFEIVVVLLGALAAFGLREPGTPVAAIWIVAGAGALLCMVAASLVKRPSGLWVGGAVQLGLVVSAVVVPMMLAVGLIFTALWVVAIVLGTRIDVERAERDAAAATLAP